MQWSLGRRLHPDDVVNRLSGEAKFVVVQRTADHRPPRPFADALRALDPVLFRPGKNEKGTILLSPIEIEQGRGVQMLACAETVAAARELSTRALDILLRSTAPEAIQLKGQEFAQLAGR